VKAWVGVTDADWIAELRSQGESVEQANFWNPGGTQAFGAVAPGEPFLFKTKKRFGNALVGAATFDAFVFLPVWEAWELFGQSNGVSTLAGFLDRVARLRRDSATTLQSQIGCTLLRDVTFFSVPIGISDDFPENAVRGKRYDLDALPGEHPVLRAATAYSLSAFDLLESAVPWELRGPMLGEARLVPPRLGQQAFKAVVASNYRHRCAVTSDKVRPVLEAAHIRPVADGGQHRSDNGLLLRSDMHTLFDRGYIGVDPKHRLVVSPRLREEFGNGDFLYARQGKVISLPERRADRPARDFLEWHLDTVFRASA
jgi:putative restriction endonuclease